MRRCSWNWGQRLVTLHPPDAVPSLKGLRSNLAEGALLAGQAGGSHLRANWWSLWSLVIIVAGVGIRLIDLGYSFDGDEDFSATLALQPWNELLAEALEDRTQGPLHIILLSYWGQLIGDTEGGLRLSSVLLSLGFLIVLRQMAKEQLDPWPGLLLLIIGALGTFFVANGQQLRPYSLALLLSCLSLLYFMRLLTRGWSRGNSMAWGAAAAAAISSSYVLAIHALVQLGLLTFLYPRKAHQGLLYLVAGLLPLGIWVWLAFANTEGLHSGLGLIGWISRPYFLDLGLFYIDLPGTLPGLPQWVSLFLLLLLALPGMLGCLSGEAAYKLRTLLVLALMPVLVVFVISQLLPVSLWATRQMTAAALAAILFMAMGFNGHNPRLTAGAICAVVIWLLIALPAALPKATKPPWRELIAGYAIGRDHDAVIINPADGWIRGPLERYLPPDTLLIMQDLGAFVQPKLPLLMCRPLRCDAVLATVQDAGYRVCNHDEHAWRSFGLVGSRRTMPDGSPSSWHMTGAEPNARLMVLTLCLSTAAGEG